MAELKNRSTAFDVAALLARYIPNLDKKYRHGWHNRSNVHVLELKWREQLLGALVRVVPQEYRECSAQKNQKKPEVVALFINKGERAVIERAVVLDIAGLVFDDYVSMSDAKVTVPATPLPIPVFHVQYPHRSPCEHDNKKGQMIRAFVISTAGFTAVGGIYPLRMQERAMREVKKTYTRLSWRASKRSYRMLFVAIERHTEEVSPPTGCPFDSPCDRYDYTCHRITTIVEVTRKKQTEIKDYRVIAIKRTEPTLADLKKDDTGNTLYDCEKIYGKPPAPAKVPAALAAPAKAPPAPDRALAEGAKVPAAPAAPAKAPGAPAAPVKALAAPAANPLASILNLTTADVRLAALAKQAITGGLDRALVARRLNTRGMRFYRKKQHARANAAFELSHTLQPAYVFPIYNRASVAGLQKDATTALTWLRKLKKLKSAGARAFLKKARTDRDFDPVRSTPQFQAFFR